LHTSISQISDRFTTPKINSARRRKGLMPGAFQNRIRRRNRALIWLLSLSSARLIADAIIPVPQHEGCNPTVKCHNVDQA
jgi:hypothetical protein